MSKEEKSILLITASSRKEGNTKSIMKYLSIGLQGVLIDLNDYEISYYDYDHENEGDDFMSIAEKMTEASIIILGTPVYWYSMAAQMKTFIDRWSDLMTVRKDLGRSLKGKQLFLISCGSREQPDKGFALPIEQTAAYMDMQFRGYFHTWIADTETFEYDLVQERAKSLLSTLKNTLD